MTSMRANSPHHFIFFVSTDALPRINTRSKCLQNISGHPGKEDFVRGH